jgi:hypothetical protein
MGGSRKKSPHRHDKTTEYQYNATTYRKSQKKAKPEQNQTGGMKTHREEKWKNYGNDWAISRHSIMLGDSH